MLQRQQLRYIVVVVKQEDDFTFNKAQLMNTAFNYIIEHTDFECIFFHDVDMISEDDRLIYKCTGKYYTFKNLERVRSRQRTKFKRLN